MHLPRQLIPNVVLRPAYRLYEARILQTVDRSRFPRHVAVILDGHRRFARAEGMTDYASSYQVGMRKFSEFLGWAKEFDTEMVTCWLLSTENLGRPAEEIDPYIEVLVEMLRTLPDRARQLGFAVRIIGSFDLLPAELVRAAKRAEEEAGIGERRLTIAVGYGGRQEIVDACRDLVADLVAEGVPVDELPDRVDAKALAAHLYAADLPDPDLVIRTSGEARMSGFLMWQAAYAEFSFTDVFWPAFRRVDYLRSLRDFSLRERRFGR